MIPPAFTDRKGAALGAAEIYAAFEVSLAAYNLVMDARTRFAEGTMTMAEFMAEAEKVATRHHEAGEQLRREIERRQRAENQNEREAGP